MPWIVPAPRRSGRECAVSNSPGSKNLLTLVIAMFAVSFLLALSAEQANAIPAFARKYKTSCSTCHYAFPRLNGFGKAFNNNGFRYPEGQDPEMTKDTPVSLGSEAYKRVWPDAIWPTDMAGVPPVSFRALGRFHYQEIDGMTTFEVPHELELLFGGTFDDKLSYVGEIELEHEAEVGYDFAIQYDFSPAAHLKIGSVGPEWTPEHHRLTKEHYNVDNLRNQSGTWRGRSGAGAGMALWGALNGSGGKGGLTYNVGIGNGQNDEENFDLNKDKDVYARATYKFGGLGEAGGTEGQASTSSAFYEDNSIRFGGFAYRGVATDGSGHDDEFNVFGGDVDLWYNRFSVTAGGMAMSSEYGSNVTTKVASKTGVSLVEEWVPNTRDSFAAFATGRCVLYPWLIGYARYEYTDIDTDSDADPQTTLIPAVIVMVRANVKCSAEYKIPLDDASQDQGKGTLQVDFAF